jgi:hypothetical protein
MAPTRETAKRESDVNGGWRWADESFSIQNHGFKLVHHTAHVTQHNSRVQVYTTRDMDMVMDVAARGPQRVQ